MAHIILGKSLFLYAYIVVSVLDLQVEGFGFQPIGGDIVVSVLDLQVEGFGFQPTWERKFSDHFYFFQLDFSGL